MRPLCPAAAALLTVVVGTSSGYMLQFFCYRDTQSIAVARANDRLIAQALDDHFGTEKSRERLVEIGDALRRFEAVNDGDGPKTLHDLVTAHELANEDRLACPRANFHYVYRPYRRDAARNLKVIFEAPSAPQVEADRVGINVLFKDGDIGLWTQNDATELLNEPKPNP